MKQKERLYTQTEIADKIGISKGTLSKWIKKENVSPDDEDRNRKLYKETLVETYKKAHKADKVNTSKNFSTVEFLQEQLKQKQDENEELRQQIRDLEAQLKGQNQEIITLAHDFSKLADQAQQLNLADKQRIEADTAVDVSSESTETKQETKSKKGFWRRIF